MIEFQFDLGFEVRTTKFPSKFHLFFRGYGQNLLKKVADSTGFRAYCILPNKGAGRVSKVRSGIGRKKLRFWAFQRWFQIENRTIIKVTACILDIYDKIGFIQTVMY